MQKENDTPPMDSESTRATDVGKFFSLVRSEGVLAAFKQAIATIVRRASAARVAWLDRLYTYMGARFDRRYGVDTLRDDPGRYWEYTDDGEGAQYYDPTPVHTFPFVMSYLPRDLSGFVFVDLGSGKGRTLLQASLHNFDRIVGVEFDKSLHETAERNLAVFNPPNKRCFDVRVVHGDATEYEIPEDNCVLYFAVQLERPDMVKVLDRIEESYRRRPRQMYLVYLEPTWSDLFDAKNFLRRKRSRRFWVFEPLPRDVDIIVYQTVPASR